MRLELELTDHQRALMERTLRVGEPQGVGEVEGIGELQGVGEVEGIGGVQGVDQLQGIDELVARAITFDAAREPEPRWREPRPRAGRTGTRAQTPRLDSVLQAATGRALELRAGERLRIEQLVDGQCVDMTVHELADAGRAFSAARTRAEHGIHPTAGDSLWSTPPETPLLTIVGDSAPAHDLCFPACTPYEYEQLTGAGGHLSCSEILAATVARWNAASGRDAVTSRLTGVNDDVLNLWLPSEVTPDGALRSWPVACRRGDQIELEACVDVVVVLSACPDDLYGSSQYEPGPVRLIVAGSERRSGRRPRTTRATRSPAGAAARHRIAVTLPDSFAAELDRVRAGGWLGTHRSAVARALVLRLLEATRPADHPHADHPHADHPHADHPHADHPHVDHPHADHPHADHPHADHRHVDPNPGGHPSPGAVV